MLREARKACKQLMSALLNERILKKAPATRWGFFLSYLVSIYRNVTQCELKNRIALFYTNTRNKKASHPGGFFVENCQTWKISIEIKRI